MDGVTLQVYKLYFTSQCNKRTDASFALLIEEKLDEHIANAETELFLLEGKVKSKFLHCGDMELNSTQVRILRKISCRGYNIFFKHFVSNNCSACSC